MERFIRLRRYLLLTTIVVLIIILGFDLYITIAVNIFNKYDNLWSSIGQYFHESNCDTKVS